MAFRDFWAPKTSQNGLKKWWFLGSCNVNATQNQTYRKRGLPNSQNNVFFLCNFFSWKQANAAKDGMTPHKQNVRVSPECEGVSIPKHGADVADSPGLRDRALQTSVCKHTGCFQEGLATEFYIRACEVPSQSRIFVSSRSGAHGSSIQTIHQLWMWAWGAPFPFNFHSLETSSPCLRPQVLPLFACLPGSPALAISPAI